MQSAKNWMIRPEKDFSRKIPPWNEIRSLSTSSIGIAFETVLKSKVMYTF